MKTTKFAESSSFANQLLAKMTLEEKVGQMTQVEVNSVKPGDITNFFLGSVLSGGGAAPTPNTAQAWWEMVSAMQDEALLTRLRIPFIYGSDAVHGHNNVYGATIFPHNIGLGATGDEELVERIGRATATELVATGVKWDFAPAVTVPRDIRWGRTYEGYGQEPELVEKLGAAFVRGLRGESWNSATSVLPSLKHFVGDGATSFGSSKRLNRDNNVELADKTISLANLDERFTRLVAEGAFTLDQGDTQIDDQELKDVHLAPYRIPLEEGALNVMASYSSIHGKKMHDHQHLLTDVLKDEMGFEGFVVSDWEAIQQIDPDFRQCVIRSINAGVDMVMVPFDFRSFISTTIEAVRDGSISNERIDDAVRRILIAKHALGLFDEPKTSNQLFDTVGSPKHKSIAREAVQKSQVLLKNEGVLPLSKNLDKILVTGPAANSVGHQCGGWTLTWMGDVGPTVPGVTILEGIQKAVAPESKVVFSETGIADEAFPVGIVVIAEEPYAEGFGDKTDLRLSSEQLLLVENAKKSCEKIVVLLISGRPRIVTEPIANWDAFIAGWLPGTEADGIADVLFGDVAFSGKLSFVWPRSHEKPSYRDAVNDALFGIGFGL